MRQYHLHAGAARKHSGIGLIEILVALFITAVGVLALTRMHGIFMQSTAENKARGEAIAIAQSRLEDMRNYMHSVNSADQFNTLYADQVNGYDLNSMSEAMKAFMEKRDPDFRQFRK